MSNKPRPPLPTSAYVAKNFTHYIAVVPEEFLQIEQINRAFQEKAKRMRERYPIIPTE